MVCLVMAIYEIHRKRGNLAGFDLDVDTANLRIRGVRYFNNSPTETYVLELFKAGVLERSFSAPPNTTLTTRNFTVTQQRRLPFKLVPDSDGDGSVFDYGDWTWQASLRAP